MIFQGRNYLYVIFLLTLLCGEFYYIEVGGGIARIYHFIAIIVIFVSLKTIKVLFRSGIFWTLLIFSLVNFIAAILSDSPEQATASLTSYLANFSISIAIVLMLYRTKLSQELFLKIILWGTVVSIIWGLIQIIAFRFGSVLALSVEQEAQILIGFGPAFRTEANTFGKYILFPFFLFLPAYLKNFSDKSLKWSFVLMAIGIFMNFTRSAIYGLLFGLFVVFIWYFYTGQLKVVFNRAVKMFFVFVAIITLVMSSIVQLSDYATYKMENFFNREEVEYGESSSYRLEAMSFIIEDTLNDSRRTIIGNGWGQTYILLQGKEVQAGGGDSVNIFGYSGAVGLLFYYLFLLTLLVVLLKQAKRSIGNRQSNFTEGLLFAFIGMFIPGQLTGYMIAPEYWLMIGACIYINLLNITNYGSSYR